MRDISVCLSACNDKIGAEFEEILDGLRLGEARGESSFGLGVRGGGGGGTGRLDAFKSELELDWRRCRSPFKTADSDEVPADDSALCLLVSGNGECSATWIAVDVDSELELDDPSRDKLSNCLRRSLTVRGLLSSLLSVDIARSSCAELA